MTTPTYNTKQKEAIEHIWGPLLIIAGPGTGKTHIIIARIIHILKNTDTLPQNVLALTFTESAAATMRKRLKDAIGSDAYRVRITTFHSFCNGIIEEYPHYFPEIIGSSHIHEAERIHILQDIIQSGSYTILKPQGEPLHYIPFLGQVIDTLKREGIDPETFKILVEKSREEIESKNDFRYTSGAHKGKVKGVYKEQLKVVEKNEELGFIYSEYQKRLAENHVYDFSDMIHSVIRAWKEQEDLLHIIQEQYQFILVDEYQDTNGSQNTILELLGSYDPEPNLCVVGDEKQAIFRFQGASIRNFSWFLETFPHARSVILEKNYRSSQKILDAAQGISGYMVKSNNTTLSAHEEKKDSRIVLDIYEKDDDELFGVAEDIAAHIKEGEDPSDIAVIYRKNRDAQGLVSWLKHFSIPYVLGSDSDIFSHPRVEIYLSLLKVLKDFGNEEALGKVLIRGIYSIDPRDIYRFLSSRSRNTSLFTHVETCGKEGYRDFEKIEEFFKKILEWKKRIESEPLLSVLYDIAYESKSIPLDATHLEQEGFFEMRALFDEIREYVSRKKDTTLSDLLEALLIMKEHGGIGKHQAGEDARGVRCLTAHGAKGREFERVYIIHTHDKHWGGGKKKSPLPLIPKVYEAMWNEYETKEEDDERRLFYVALTRAKKHIHMSYAQYDIQGRDRVPTQFLEEMPKEYIVEKKHDSRNDTALPQHNRSPESERDELKTLVSNIFSTHPLSVTALNNYLTCPWKYFYINLLRIPQEKVSHLIFGTAIHEALRVYFDLYKEGKEDLEAVRKTFSETILEEHLQEQEEKELLERGRETLEKFIAHRKDTWERDLDTEVTIQIEYKGVNLTGKIDKIEHHKDYTRVIDYKTGKTRSRAYIMGETQESQGDIFRQLVFYKLLLETYNPSAYSVQEGEIDFVEPTDAGKYKTELFDLTQEHVEELSQTLVAVAQEIQSLHFWDKRCHDKECEFCSMRYEGV